jgi:hypothetical protein
VLQIQQLFPFLVPHCREATHWVTGDVNVAITLPNFLWLESDACVALDVLHGFQNQLSLT